jgi:hypothetical protein
MVTKIQFERPADAPSLMPHIKYAASLELPVVEKNCHEGEKALICSTGPSIRNKTVVRQVKKLAKTHTVFGLKETIPYLKKKGVKVSYTVAMDPGGVRQVARTPIDKDVTYCIASSCNPALFDHILAGGCTIKVFHSACGEGMAKIDKGTVVEAGHGQYSVIEGELELTTMKDGYAFCPIASWIMPETDVYWDLFNGYAATMCGGFTVTNRALALVNYMGFSEVVMAGTDFGWRKEGGSHYCDLVQVGANDDSYMTDEGVVDGKTWFTKPDQLASAADVAKKIKAGEVTVIGDSLAAALSKKDSGFLEDIVQLQ